MDEGFPMRVLLSELLEVRRNPGRGTRHLPSIGYVRRLLAALGSPHTSTGPLAPGGYAPGQDQLIAEGLSNQEIAVRLFIATSTAKGYVHSILRKLEVESRSRAVARARTSPRLRVVVPVTQAVLAAPTTSRRLLDPTRKTHPHTHLSVDALPPGALLYSGHRDR